MTTSNDTACLCPNCKTDLKKLRHTQVQAHLYIDNFVYPGVADYIKKLKASNQLTKTVISALNLYRSDSAINRSSIEKSIFRIESILEITSDKALVKTLKNELSIIKSSIPLGGT